LDQIKDSNNPDFFFLKTWEGERRLSRFSIEESQGILGS
jgi:hypothetical protein